MSKLKQCAALVLTTSLAIACDDDTGVPTGNETRRTTSTNCPVSGGGTSGALPGGTSGGENTAGDNEAIDDGDCTTAGSGTSGGTSSTSSSGDVMR